MCIFNENAGIFDKKMKIFLGICCICQKFLLTLQPKSAKGLMTITITKTKTKIQDICLMERQC